MPSTQIQETKKLAKGWSKSVSGMSRSPSPGKIPATPPANVDECLNAFCWIWGLSQPLQMNRGNLVARGPFQIAQALACAGVAVWPSKWLLAVAVTGRLMQFAFRFPFTFDSEVLQMFLHAAVLLHVVASRKTHASHMLGTTTRRILGIFYCFAGGWKINTSFLDYRYSCGSIYFAQLIDAYAPILGVAPSADLVLLAIQVAPWVTVAMECGVGVAMLLAEVSPLWGWIAVVLASALHIGIDITPKPNNIASFSHACGIAYMWFVPTGVTTALHEARSSLLVSACYVSIGAALLGLTLYAQRPDLLFDPSKFTNGNLDLHIPAHAMLTALLFRAVYLRGWKNTTIQRNSGLPSSYAPKHHEKPSSTGRCIGAFLVATSFSWAFGSVAFGLMEMNSPNMFSNVRMQGGSNHYVLPTGLLQQWYYDGWQATDNPFTGGVVRIENTNSSWMNGLYPAEYTPVLTTGTQDMLKTAGHSGRHFNSLISRVVGAFAVPQRSEESAFVKYTLPAFELRRLIHEARQRKESFTLEYSHLPGITGDEHWRIAATDRTVTLVDADGTTTCAVSVMDGKALAVPTNCTEFDLPVAAFPRPNVLAQPFLSTLGLMQVWNSYPILNDDDTELHCYGS